MGHTNRFLVHGKFVDPGPLLTPDRSLEMSRTQVLPSQQLLADWEADGTIVAGGVYAGAREIVFLVDVSSNDELSALISSIPFWSLLTWDVQPLQLFKTRADLSAKIFKSCPTHSELHKTAKGK